MINQGSVCTATVSDASANGTPIRPTGTVSFSKGAGDAGSFDNLSCNLPASGPNSCSVTYTPSAAGSSTITGTYGNDSNHNGSNGNDTVTAAKRDSSTSVSCSPASVVINQGSVCTATVSDASANGTPIRPTGTVSFSKGAGDAGSFDNLSCNLPASGPNSCSVTYTPSAAGSSTITGTYGNDSNHNGSNGNDTVTAAKRDSSTSVSCSPASVVINQGSVCTATVSDASANGTPIRPTGTVSFSKGAGDAGSFDNLSCNLPASGPNSCSVTYTPSAAGSSTITGTYGNDSNHNGSNGNDTVTAAKRDSSTSVSCSPNPDTYNVASSCTATVTDAISNAGTGIRPSGTVSFDKGAASGNFSSATCTLPASGTNQCSVTYTPTAVGAGTHVITGTYGGDPVHNGSNNSTNLTVNKANQTISFTKPSDQYWGAHSITVSATGGGSSNPVTFTTTTSSVCTSGGANGATITFVGVGTCTVKASQAGNDNYNPAADVYQSFQVKKDPTLITLDSTTSGSNFSCSNAYTATLTDTITGNGIAGIPLTLTIGTQSRTANTDSTGTATFNLTLNQATGVVAESVALSSSFTWSDANRIAPLTATRANPPGFTVNPDLNVGPVNNASTLYTGSRFFWTTSSTSSTATLTLTATIKDTGVCANDPTIHGDITKSNVSFQISSNDGTSWGPVSSGQNLPVGLVDPSDSTVGTASVISQYNIGKNQSATLWVKVIVGGEYKFNSDVYDVPITIAMPGVANELLAGGGLANDGTSLVGTSGFLSSGFLGAGNGLTSGGIRADLVDFSGTVIYSKSGTNPQGQLTLMIHSWNKPDGTQDGQRHTYFVKSNSIASLSLLSSPPTAPTPSARTATFSSKTNVYDITGTKVGLDGGGTMQFTFTEPGGQYKVTSSATGQPVTLTCPTTATSGCASVIVYKSTGGVWFSSAWGPATPATGEIAQTLEKAMLAGGTSKIS